MKVKQHNNYEKGRTIEVSKYFHVDVFDYGFDIGIELVSDNDSVGYCQREADEMRSILHQILAVIDEFKPIETED